MTRYYLHLRGCLGLGCKKAARLAEYQRSLHSRVRFWIQERSFTPKIQWVLLIKKRGENDAYAHIPSISVSIFPVMQSIVSMWLNWKVFSFFFNGDNRPPCKAARRLNWIFIPMNLFPIDVWKKSHLTYFLWCCEKNDFKSKHKIEYNRPSINKKNKNIVIIKKTWKGQNSIFLNVKLF